jgi:superfamily I DNA/RNA helicase
MYTPTAEQQAIKAAFRKMMDGFNRDNRKLVINAGAGTGKTSTLVMLAEIAAEFGKQGTFMAFNKAIVESATLKMPTNVKCRTFHAYFYGMVGQFYKHRSPSVSAAQTAVILGITEELELSEKKLSPVQQARLIYRAINRFSMSDDMEISRFHVPYVRGVTDDDMELIRATLSTYLTKAWADIVDYKGKLRFKPENYIKIGALRSPKVKASFIFIDEAQDTFPVILGWLKRQPHVRLVVVGDDAQAINEWTGAVNSMSKFHGKDEYGNEKDDVVYLNLSKSFRFGENLADEANRWLSILGEFYITGDESKETTITEIDEPNFIYDAIICRTNAGVFSAAMKCVESGIKTAMSKRNMEDLKDIAKAAMQLMAGAPSDYPGFEAFKNWDEVLEYVENDPGGSDIKTIVTIVDKFGPDALMNLSDSLVPEGMAQTQIITAHTSKGLEFDSVMIWNDFPEPKETKEGEQGEIQPEDARLAYVAITRAMKYICILGLAWVKDYVRYDDEDGEDEY